MAKGCNDRPWSSSNHFINLCVSVSSSYIRNRCMDPLYILFFVGIEKIITGIFLPQRSKWATIGLGVLVLIFAGLAIAYPEATAFVVIIFIGVALLFNGIARVVEGMSGHHSGWGRASTYRCWNIINNLIDSSNGISCLWCCPCRHYHCHSSVDNWNADGCNRFCWPENEESNQRY